MLRALVVRAFLKPHRLVRWIRDTLRVRRLVRISRLQFVQLSFELLADRRFHRHLKGAIKVAAGECQDPRLGGWIDYLSGALIYVIVRYARPEIMVETGVGPGGTTAFILLAMHKNQCGKLHSIDLPGNDAVVYPTLGKDFNIHIPEGSGPGWLVPSWLRDRWELTLGDSREQLPAVLSRLGRTDMFMHDSLHTDEHITMEFETVLPYMSPGQIILCDDVSDYWSLAFLRICEHRSIRHVRYKERVGVGVLPGVGGVNS
ncbi:MAG TPA: class I SAM-dependent methyltransferase [Thermoguttaceae bacterium]|nr:class I SAM-dependent methyltransferase [Thermoguttaceae bacterium]